MSFFRKSTTSINDQNCLIDTLKALGYKPQVNDKKVPVRGHGSETKTAEIILRKEDLGDGGDVGFSKDKEGNFEIITDTYVMRKIKLAEFTETVNKEYGVTKAKAIAKKNGWSLISNKSIDKNGKSVQKLQFVVA